VNTVRRLLPLIVLAMPAAAAAETEKTALARELFDLGVEEYKTKQYAAAAASMSKSHALDPQPNTPLIGDSGETRTQKVALVPTRGGSLVSWSSTW